MNHALFVTGDFETIGDPWTAVSGDFDRMGISCGPLQWNIGFNSFQPVVLGCGQEVVRRAMPGLGREMWDACNASITEGLRIVRGWQTGSRLRKDAEREIKALLDQPEMRDGMRRKAAHVGELAFREASAWASGKPTLRQFCWFFYLITQNGGLRGRTRGDVEGFKSRHSSNRVDDLICDELDDRPLSSRHDRDAHRNARLWRNPADGTALDLLVLSYIRASLFKPEWRHVVMNRKGTLAIGKGWVNGEQYEFA